MQNVLKAFRGGRDANRRGVHQPQRKELYTVQFLNVEHGQLKPRFLFSATIEQAEETMEAVRQGTYAFSDGKLVQASGHIDMIKTSHEVIKSTTVKIHTDDDDEDEDEPRSFDPHND